MLGELPRDFLRVSAQPPPDADQQLAMALDRQLNAPTCSPMGRLNITVDQVNFILRLCLVYVFGVLICS